MKVLHVIPSLSLLHGGPSVAVHAMCKALARLGVTVHVATTDDGMNGPDVLLGQPVEQDNFTAWHFHCQTRFYTVSVPLTLWLARHLRDYDLVHIHSLFSYSSAVSAHYAATHGVPYIVRPLGTLNRWGITRRHPWLKRISFALIERCVLAGAAFVHYTSDRERLEAEQLGAFGPHFVLPLGIDLDPFRSSVSEGSLLRPDLQLPGRVVVLFLSRLDPKKGLDLLLPAFARVRRKYDKMVLVLAGEGPSQFVSTIRKQADYLGIGPEVLFVGFLHHDQKLAALRSADIFVLPSYSENFGIAVVEAMAAGLPVVITDQVGLCDDVSRAHAGLVVPCNVEALAQAIQLLAGDPDLRRHMGENGQRLAYQRFSQEAMAKSLLAFYEKAAQAAS
jgi:glycosyltransferase involved in cell wall biosynthesis